MKYDFNANETMKRIGRSHPVYRDSPEGKEVEELLTSLELPLTNENVTLACFAYVLGRSRKNRKKEVVGA